MRSSDDPGADQQSSMKGRSFASSAGPFMVIISSGAQTYLSSLGDCHRALIATRYKELLERIAFAKWSVNASDAVEVTLEDLVLPAKKLAAVCVA